jgi:hypothetical protein
VNKNVPLVSANSLKILKIAGVGQGIEVDDWTAFAGKPVKDKIRSDETSPASHKD